MSIVEFRPKLVDALRGYSLGQLMSDSLAGLIVAVVAALPLAIAFAVASGVSPEVGLVSAIVGGFLIAILGGCSVQIAGPTGSFIIVIYMVVQQYGTEGLLWATLLSGLMLLVMGFLKLGSLIKYIPYPVVVGFTAGMAVVIFSTQVNEFFGLGIKSLPADFLSKWIAFASVSSQVDLPTLSIGLISVGLIYLSPRLTKKVPGSLIALIVTTLLAYGLRQWAGVDSVTTIGDRFSIEASLPAPSLPKVDFSMISSLAQPAFSIALIGAIESLLTARVVDSMAGERHNSNTELIALGVANITVPLLGGMPVTGATARTMTNYNNGGRTPIAGVVHALVLLLSLLFLMPVISYIPMASLAGVLVVVSINMSGVGAIRSILQGPRADGVVLVVSFVLTVLFDLTVAIEVGLLLSMLFFMQRMVESTRILVSKGSLRLRASGALDSEEEEALELPKGVEVYEIEGPFFFGIANHFETLMSGEGIRPEVRILRLRLVPFMDATALHNLELLCRKCNKEGIRLILSGVSKSLRQTLHSAHIDLLIGEDNICPDIHIALEKAQQYLEEKR